MARESSDRFAQALHNMTNQSETTDQPSAESVPSQTSSRPARPTSKADSSMLTRKQHPNRVDRPSQPGVTQPISESISPSVSSGSSNYSKKSATQARSRKSISGSLEFRRTLIPPCLVVGTCFIGFMLFFFFQPEDAALRQVRWVVPVGMGILGFLLLGVGVLNMFLVKKELDHRRRHTPVSHV
ncbi:MAG: hypothetical protein KatS3mg104_1605 [Phycisphaerae bacterium]|nr:MAG: hypothetical protein KatS3mg104_1605 [Phycisphaerae bacterium]